MRHWVINMKNYETKTHFEFLYKHKYVPCHTRHFDTQYCVTYWKKTYWYETFILSKYCSSISKSFQTTGINEKVYVQNFSFHRHLWNIFIQKNIFQFTHSGKEYCKKIPFYRIIVCQNVVSDQGKTLFVVYD